jgi:two-component system, NtrC family, sensor histidine kinase HydH
VEAALRLRHPRPFTNENLVIVHREVERLERIVQGLLDFARPSPLQRKTCDLRDVVGGATALVLIRAAQQDIRIDAEFPDGPAPASVDPDRLRSVLVNLLLNALDAMPEGGHIGVRLAEQTPGLATIAVSDTGPGFTRSVQAQLFTPFVSTKATGTGLGLCVCRRIVEEHGGRIQAENLLEGGARFTITLSTAN